MVSRNIIHCKHCFFTRCSVLSWVQQHISCVKHACLRRSNMGVYCVSFAEKKRLNFSSRTAEEQNRQLLHPHPQTARSRQFPQTHQP